MRTRTPGNFAVSCSAPGSPNNSREAQISTAPVLATGNLSAPVATQSIFGVVTDHYYRLVGQSGHLAVQALAYSLFSRSDIQVELLDSSGVAVNQTTSPNVFSAATSGYINYDASTTANLPGVEDLIVHVFTRSALPVSSFPSGTVGVDSTPYYVLSVSRGQNTPVYAANARCEAADSFAAYVSPGNAAPFSTPTAPTSSGGCGTITRSDADQDPMGPGGIVRLANFAGLIILMLMARRRLTPARQN